MPHAKRGSLLLSAERGLLLGKATAHKEAASAHRGSYCTHKSEKQNVKRRVLRPYGERRALVLHKRGLKNVGEGTIAMYKTERATATAVQKRVDCCTQETGLLQLRRD